MNSLKIKKGDTVQVMIGKDKGKKGIREQGIDRKINGIKARWG